MKTINKILLIAGFAFFLFRPIDGLTQYVYSDAKLQKQLDQARNDVYQEKFHEAIAKYAALVKSNDDKTVSVEYAYALALTGCYSGAIMNLDKVLASGQADKDVLFYTSQVLKLMEYDSVADVFWSYGKLNKAYPPSWISGRYKEFARKYRHAATINTDDLATALQRANKLAERHQIVQSLVLFLELIDFYPDEYLPYVGLSALWENLGCLKEAEKSLSTGIEKMGKNKYQIDPFGHYEKHLEALKACNGVESKVMQQPPSNGSNGNNPKRFSYFGISYINKSWAFNWKYGLYVDANSSFSAGFGLFISDGIANYSADLSVMVKVGKVFLAGANISAQFSKEYFRFGLGPTLGFAIPLSNGKSSIDILSTLNIYMQKEIQMGSSVSIGYTHYF